MSSPPSSVDPPEVDLWVARDPQLREPSVLADFERVLDAADRARVAGMRFAAGRHQQLVTRAMARLVLSSYRPEIAPGAWRFQSEEHGRPTVAPEMSEAARALNFNLAHTQGLVVMAVGRLPGLGVDVERADDRPRLALARRYFSAVEAAALEALPADQQPRRFKRLWTLKEAYLKAIGTGVAGGLGSMTFHVDEGELRFERSADPDAAHWRFHELEIDGGFLVALACKGPPHAIGPRISLRQFPAGIAAAEG